MFHFADSMYSSSSAESGDDDVISGAEEEELLKRNENLVGGSFKQQLSFMLTSRERQRLVRALQNYSERR